MHCARPQVALQCQTQWRQFGIGPGGGRLQVDEALGRQHCRSRLQCGQEQIAIKRRVDEHQVQAGRCALAQLRAASCSTMHTLAAPREAASSPSAPVPEKASRQRQPDKSWPSQLNRVSRTRSGVGRRPGKWGTGRRVRFHCPPMMRISPAPLRSAGEPTWAAGAAGALAPRWGALLVVPAPRACAARGGR